LRSAGYRTRFLNETTAFDEAGNITL